MLKVICMFQVVEGPERKVIPDTPTVAWANKAKKGFRCTKCGQLDHPKA